MKVEGGNVDFFAIFLGPAISIRPLKNASPCPRPTLAHADESGSQPKSAAQSWNKRGSGSLVPSR
jgi:hypothetical protein